MSIHAKIKSAREKRGWSQQRLADEVSRLEGLPKPLNWQTVQQWEKTTAPKNSRLRFVAAALGVPPGELLDTSSDALLAHPLSQAVSIMPLRAMPWRELKMITKPGVVYAEVGEHSIEQFKIGTVLRFEFGAAPEFGDKVLIRDAAGELHFRIYSQALAGGWVGVADRVGFMPLSPVDGAQVVAVKTAHFMEER